MQNYVITIARSYGSGGKTIGKMLAEELGISFYSRELLRLASDQSGINEELFGKADEKLKSSILYKIMHKTYKGELIPPDSDEFVSNDNLFNYQAKVMKELAERESCIMVGRCADYVLKDYKNIIRLFVYAPYECCMQNLMERFSEPRKELEKKMISIDKHRAEYYEYYTGRKWNDARNYDLCINTNEMKFEQVVTLVQSYLSIKLKQ